MQKQWLLNLLSARPFLKTTYYLHATPFKNRKLCTGQYMSHIFRFFKGVMAFRAAPMSHIGMKSFLKNGESLCPIQVFLDFRAFDFCNFRFNGVYNSILFFSPLVLLSNFDLHSFPFCIFLMCPHINSVNQGIPVNKIGISA